MKWKREVLFARFYFSLWRQIIHSCKVHCRIALLFFPFLEVLCFVIGLLSCCLLYLYYPLFTCLRTFTHTHTFLLSIHFYIVKPQNQ